MNWFYADAGKQAGPVNDADFERLVREGVVQSATLVWRDGMANWQPLAVARPDLLSAPPLVLQSTAPVAPTGQVICAECKKAVPVEETIQIGAATVCSACKPIYVQKLREGAITFAAPAPAMRYAGFWIRVGAKLIDSMILMVVTMPLSFLFGFKMALNPAVNMPDIATILGQQAILIGFSTVTQLLYTWLLVGRYGATWGKMAVGIKVVRADGQRVDYLRAFARYWAEMVSGLACYVGYIIVAFDAEKRALHDHMCNTRVIYK